MTTQYLIDIYDIEESNKSKIYYAYAAILSMIKKEGNKKEESLGGEDIRTKTDLNSDVPIARFKYNEKGEILTFEVNKKINEILSSYLYEFVKKVIPETSFNKRRLNENSPERFFRGDKQNGRIYHSEQNANDDNEELTSWETKIEGNKVKGVSSRKDYSLSTNKESQISLDHNNNNFTDDVQDDKNANREGVIKHIVNNDTSDISLLDDDSVNDENISNQIKNLINSKKISFENYFNKIKKTNSVIKGINELRRNLETLNINTYGMPIYFTYPIFRTHLL